jgi:bifunctional non-homologous end joining protein LigD
VIGGYTLSEGNQKYFGSLLAGYQSPDGLTFAGRVGTGFSEKFLASIDAQLQKLRRATCRFVNRPEKTKGRWGLGITSAFMKRCHWVKLVLIGQRPTTCASPRSARFTVEESAVAASFVDLYRCLPENSSGHI